MGSLHYAVDADEVLDPYDRNVFGDDVRGGDCDTDGGDGDDTNAMPESFDARTHWFECPSISHIWNQGNCAADWVRLSNRQTRFATPPPPVIPNRVFRWN